MARPEIELPGQFRGAVFDFDGLLVDSEPGWARAEERLLERRGVAFTDQDRAATVGRSIDASIAEYAARLGLDGAGRAGLRTELLELARHEYQAGFSLRPGAAELIALLRPSMLLALASNTDRALVELALAATPFAASFDAIVTGDDIRHHKPAPDIYLLACEWLGVRTRDAIAFEDSIAGVRSALAAGVTVVAVPQRAGPEFVIADLVVASLGDLRVVSADSASLDLPPDVSRVPRASKRQI